MDIGAELSKVGEAVKSAVGLGGSAAAGVAEAAAADVVGGAETAVAGATKAAEEAATGAVSEAGSAVMQAASSAGAAVVSAVAGAGPMIEKALPLVEDAVGAAACLATGNVACAISKGVEMVGDVGTMIGGTGAVVANAVQQTVTTVTSAVAAAPAAAAPVVQDVTKAAGAVVQAVEAAGLNVAGLVSQLFAGGVVALIEKEMGSALSDEAKARVLAVVQGLVTVVGSLKF